MISCIKVEIVPNLQSHGPPRCLCLKLLCNRGAFCYATDMQTTAGLKRVLVYGDSITWGRIPNDFGRHNENSRWTSVLQQKLGDSFEVVEEGLRGRFLAGEHPYMPNRDGLQQFGPIFASHLPLNLLILFLGTNDTNAKANKSRPISLMGCTHISRLLMNGAKTCN